MIGVIVIRRGRRRAGLAIVGLALVLPVVSSIIISEVFEARTFRLPSENMAPTFEPGDRIVTTKTSEPERRDIVVVEAPLGAETLACGVPEVRGRPCPRPTAEDSGTTFIKRVVGEPGDRLKVLDGRVYIDGERQDEPYIRPSADCEMCDLPREITIPDGHYFLMGDNRGMSADSREWGPVREDAVVGEVRLRYWPLGDFGTP